MTRQERKRVAAIAAALVAREATVPDARRIGELVALASEGVRRGAALLELAERRRHGVPDA